MKINTEKIKKELARRGWSKNHFALKCDMTRQAFEYILKARTTTFSTLDKIAKVLEFEPKDLLN